MTRLAKARTNGISIVSLCCSSTVASVARQVAANPYDGDPVRRVAGHKDKVTPRLHRHLGVNRLVWFESYDDPANAIAREKAIKKWRWDCPVDRRSRSGLARPVSHPFLIKHP